MLVAECQKRVIWSLWPNSTVPVVSDVMFVVSGLIKQQLKTIRNVPEATSLQTTANVKYKCMHHVGVLHLLFNCIYLTTV